MPMARLWTKSNDSQWPSTVTTWPAADGGGRGCGNWWIGPRRSWWNTTFKRGKPSSTTSDGVARLCQPLVIGGRRGADTKRISDLLRRNFHSIGPIRDNLSRSIFQFDRTGYRDHAPWLKICRGQS